MNSLREDIKALFSALVWYSKRKIRYFAHEFEDFKNFLVEVLMQGRGVHQKHFWHGSMIALAVVGILTSGVFGGRTLISSTYPGIGGPDPRFTTAFEPFPNGPILQGFGDTRTSISQKPRSEIEEYKVKDGDTLSSIAKEKGISSDTIRWANNLSSDTIKPGETLKILPVSGLSHIVKSGDTLESLAKKYSAEQQAILDFPFNDIPDDFSLKVGQLLIIPDGTPVAIAPVKSKAQPQYLAQGPASPAFVAPFGAQFIWPTNGIITQYYSWYHPGIDVANRAAPTVAGSDGGVVLYAGWDNTGYGNRVDIDHKNGYLTRYAHLSNIYVSFGDTITRGQLIGQMGSTGRSTGTHLHFEIHYKGVAVNPLAILK